MTTVKEIFSYARGYIFDEPHILDAYDKKEVTHDLLEWLSNWLGANYIDGEEIMYVGELLAMSAYTDLDRKLFSWLDENNTIDAVNVIGGFLYGFWGILEVNEISLNRLEAIADNYNVKEAIANTSSKEYDAYECVLLALLSVAKNNKNTNDVRNRIINKLTYHYKWIKKGGRADGVSASLGYFFDNVKDYKN